MKHFVAVLISVISVFGLTGCFDSSEGEGDSEQKKSIMIGGVVTQERFDSCMRYGMDSHPDCKKYVEWFCSTVGPNPGTASRDFNEWFKYASACEMMRQEAGYQALSKAINLGPSSNFSERKVSKALAKSASVLGIR